MCLLYTLSMRHTQTHTPSHTHTNSHRVSSKIYNIHNYLLKQNRLFFSHPGYMTRQANTACRFIIFDQKKGRLSLFICVFLSFFFFFAYKRVKNTHTQRHTLQRPTQHRDSKDLLQVFHARSSKAEQRRHQYRQEAALLLPLFRKLYYYCF